MELNHTDIIPIRLFSVMTLWLKRILKYTHIALLNRFLD